MGRLTLLLASILLSTQAFADWSQIVSDLKKMDENPSEVLNQVPRKSVHFTHFDNQQILTQSFIEEKTQQRQACTRGTDPSQPWTPFAIPQPNDNVELLLQGRLKTKNIFELDELNVLQGEVETLPWSGDYWPIASGILGNRPFDSGFYLLENWVERYNYFQKQPMHKIVDSQPDQLTTLLSPSEKYELFVGDMNSFLTQQMWLEGKAYQEEHGEVEEWMGICHGWAPASYMMKGPQKTLNLKSYDQKQEFKVYPDEMKGLASYLWASSPFEAVYIGGRCQEKEPKQDKNGRVTDPKCFDSNPATWHLAITHRVGMEKKSFIIDATYDYEVWNQPVAGYTFQYFNMNTKKLTKNLKAAITPRSELKKDIFEEYRNPKSVSTVGIAMRLGYVVESGVDDHPSEPPPYSSVVWVDYMYDLELDKQGNIVGGEWYSNLHPDFLWTPKDDAQTISQYDFYVKDEKWDGKGPLPEKWIKASEASHYYQKQVLTPIIYKLMEMARD